MTIEHCSPRFHPHPPPSMCMKSEGGGKERTINLLAGATTQSYLYSLGLTIAQNGKAHTLPDLGMDCQVGDDIRHAVDGLPINSRDNITADGTLRPIDGHRSIAAL